jgi:hypothetical protein
MRQSAMASPSTVVAHFNWQMQIYAVVGALVFFTAIGLLQFDTSLILYIFVSAILSICIIFLLLYAAFAKNRRRDGRQLLTLTIFWIISASFFVFGRSHPIAIRTAVRWLADSRDYKAQVLAQPQPPNGELKHIEWDGWGMSGQITDIYLVYDPTDSLSVAALNSKSGEFNGIPCEVLLLHRLESHWYTVLFYTSETWDYCS